MFVVDSHCHLDRLDLEPHEGRLENALSAAMEAGVGHFLSVSIDLERWPAMAEQVAEFDHVSLSVGVHPDSRDVEEPTVERLSQLSERDGVVAIGETGLDYFRQQAPTDWQRDRFRTHIRAAVDTGLPLIIHSRAAKQDTLDILRKEGAERVGGVLHCFTEDFDMARQAMELGFYISLSGIVTFRNADDLRATAVQLPLERMLVETDSPYLAPVPHRGQSNHPAWVVDVARAVAELRGIDFDDLCQATTGNFFELFPKAQPQVRA